MAGRAFNPLENALDIPQVVDGIRENYDIEGTLHRGEIVNISQDEIQVGMFCPERVGSSREKSPRRHREPV